MSATASRNSDLEGRPGRLETFSENGTAASRATSESSRRGERASMELAIVMRSTLASISPGSQRRTSSTFARFSGDRPAYRVRCASRNAGVLALFLAAPGP
jgi:hypothetical protein